MSFDYSEFRNYRDNFDRFTRQFDSWMHRFLLEMGMRFIAEVKPRTPVDTGDLRNHWELDGITREGDELKVWFVNSMHYATHVEYGHAKPYKSGATEGSADWVDGYFMMTVSLEIIQRKLPAQFNSAFTKFITDLGVM